MAEEQQISKLTDEKKGLEKETVENCWHIGGKLRKIKDNKLYKRNFPINSERMARLIQLTNEIKAIQENTLRVRRDITKLTYRIKKIKTSEATKKYQQKYPERVKAMNYAQKYKQRGDKCEKCGDTRKLNFHHTDYKNNKGITVCPKCHQKIHGVYNYGNKRND